ncbi:LOW QUALITY PROTEIN: lysine-specific demethylase 4B-like [Alosa sapidissima]|uniref:LOW QUALITY PROTEIN: lysine-specific demethylase 4B-like n=1 Tax=Alosa sapidissima TaxID=34773 RepID=UPI001C089789|nr:LOW QUALITY PROTEIN: lysine-specific demethylase 4B-like [Alosa sapidissima]
MRSPLFIVKQETFNDEGGDVEQEVHSAAQLWQDHSPNLLAERRFNAAMATIEPHCAVCTLFCPYKQEALSLDSASLLASGCGRFTRPLVPEMCFSSGGDTSEPPPPRSSSGTRDDGTSLLISCSSCSLQVHASCYGVQSDMQKEGWMCSRCTAVAWTAACCLCNLRGGALKMTTDSRWVHVMCAISVPEARFVNATEREPVDVTAIPDTRKSLMCVYCHKPSRPPCGACIQCSHESCSTSFHVTCAHLAGVVMKPADWPYVVSVTCQKHKRTNQKVKVGSRDLLLGQQVIGRYSNGWFYRCIIIGMATQILYEVNFDDGSYCDNVYPENVVSHDCLRSGPPETGEILCVCTADGQMLNASFIKEHTHRFYQVEFQDMSQLLLKRSEIYTLEQELPKRVMARLVLSAVKPESHSQDDDEAQAAKRPRLPVPPPQEPAPLTPALAPPPQEQALPSPALAPPPAPEAAASHAHNHGPAPGPYGFLPPTSPPPHTQPAPPTQATHTHTHTHTHTPVPQEASYTPSSGYVAYMEALLNSNFPSEEGPAHEAQGVMY